MIGSKSSSLKQKTIMMLWNRKNDKQAKIGTHLDKNDMRPKLKSRILLEFLEKSYPAFRRDYRINTTE